MDTPQTPTPDVATTDVVIIGASFAGLAAALLLGRAQHHVTIIGDGPARNAETDHAHNVPTREGADPADLLAAARAEVDALPTVARRTGMVSAVEEGSDGRLLVRSHDDHVISARHVVLATGARDSLPRIAGLPAIWGRQAHSCPFCDAAPYAGRPVLVIADEPVAGHLGGLLSGWTDQVQTASPSDVASTDAAADGVAVRLTDGSELRVDGVFVHATPQPRTSPVDGLALQRRHDFVATDVDGRTSLPGLWAVGDCAWPDSSAQPGGQVLAAMAAGSRAGIAITLERAGITPPPTPERSEPTTVDREDPHAHWEPDPDETLATFWDTRYAERGQVWTGRPNVGLVDAVSDLRPGRALDLGAGEGGDAIWLAKQGWDVTAVDVSRTAMDRLDAAAVAEGVADLVTSRVQDLATGTVDGSFDLVTTSYLLSPVEIPREQIVRRAKAAVARGGTYVILSHLATPGHAHDGFDLPDIDEQLNALELEGGWQVVRAEPLERRAQWHDGTIITMTDSLIVLRRS
ncbi:FAD-dependent oxidoreductase [Euzebya tangerina]|uniref:FAD-dependent oxidoreductase n=1 Tax=Euzebya tangerina TaxID=591198 RepID=UPI000E3157AA|nr:FAD-dependent oxidoreductase [Euzebya tangerina]